MILIRGELENPFNHPVREAGFASVFGVISDENGVFECSSRNFALLGLIVTLEICN